MCPKTLQNIVRERAHYWIWGYTLWNATTFDMQDTNITNYHVLRPQCSSPTIEDSIFWIYFGFQHTKKSYGTCPPMGMQKFRTTLERTKQYQMSSIICVLGLRRCSHSARWYDYLDSCICKTKFWCFGINVYNMYYFTTHASHAT